MLIAFQPNDQSEMTLRLENATPNAFPEGPIGDYLGTGKRQGFTYGQIGDPLTDRTYNTDDPYALHDALHLGVLTATGWSPVVRQLLGLRRRSDRETDDIADGPRAVLAEEQILNAYASELVHDGPIPRAIGKVSLEASAQVQDFLPPGTSIPAETFKDGLRLGGTLMFMLQTFGPTAPQRVRVDLDAKDVWVFSGQANPAQSKGASVRQLANLLTPKRNPLAERYGTFMGIDSKGQGWYLQTD